MKPCECGTTHALRRVVLTGGPGAGKTAVLELVRQNFCRHVAVLPEAASLLFSGGFPRGSSERGKRVAQQAIFAIQRQLEALDDPADNHAVLVCDRGTIDCAAYWPGPDDFFAAMGTTREAELQRYHAVIHLRTPLGDAGYNHSNPERTESAEAAATIDERLAMLWLGHPRRLIVDRNPDFLEKASLALSLLRGEVPDCCR